MTISSLPVLVRDAEQADMGAILSIYTHFVLRSCCSFEEVPPTLEEMQARRARAVARGLPYLVAVADDEIVGYTYAGPFRPRSAYRYTIEDSIYVAPTVGRRGIGSVLLSSLVERCTNLGYRRMIGVVGDSANQASIALHRKVGFRQEGVLRGVGLKFGKWIDVVIMHRVLADEHARLPEGV
jgi:phosphinothricin acetyltransferase